MASAAPAGTDADPPIVPGGSIAIVDRLLAPSDAAARLRSASGAPRLQLDARQVSDVHCIAVGAFSPLSGFMGAADHASVVSRMVLASGAVWSLPVVLAVDAELARTLRAGQDVVLDDTAGEPLAILEVSEVYDVDLDAEVEQTFGTADPAHPGVAARLAQGPRCVAGEISALRIPHSAFPKYDLTPAQARAAFAERGWRTVVGFQTRNPVHRAHEYLQKVALETIDGLFLQPLVGETKGDDVPAAVRMRCYTTLTELYYPPDRVVLGTFPAAMRYAGPREAVFHATVRRNYGCTHFIVGRDHAGVGAYYGTYDAQLIFDRVDPVALGIIPLRFEHTFWCHRCEGMASTRTCPHGGDDHLILSGTKVRAMLSAGELPPPEFSRPEVARMLVEAYAAG
ncbi:MAG TPA: sulfate adenylyltransferase [Candidatus Dormibacteraeota bacterium]|nr:sulfate adenylyltransferase [Candidatus Dormibacteraeota bacterium]